jgi:hypothetical protein
MPDDVEPVEHGFHAETIYGAMTDQPLVKITSTSTFPFMVSPNEARRMAMVLLEVAEAAEMDATVYRWMRGAVGATVEQSARMMAEFRTIRVKLADEQP